MDAKNLFEDIVAHNIEFDHHYSDLYVPANELTRQLIRKWNLSYVVFNHQSKNGVWYDIPFAYIPYWETKDGT